MLPYGGISGVGNVPLGWIAVTLVAMLMLAAWGYRHMKPLLWVVSWVANRCRYWYHLSFEHDTQPQWAGLTRQDMSRARAKAKRMMARGPGTTPPEGQPKPKRVGHRMRATRRYRRAKRRGELIQPPVVAPLEEEAPHVPPPAPKVRYRPPKLSRSSRCRERAGAPGG
jgi:hypothetical protein